MAAVTPSRLIEEGRLPALIFAGAAAFGTICLAVGFFISPPGLKAMLADQLSNIVLTCVGAAGALSGWVTHNKRKERESEIANGTAPRLVSVKQAVGDTSSKQAVI